jgi:hypothetical protein
MSMSREAAAALLGVPAFATEDEIRGAHRGRARLAHPDLQEEGTPARATAETLMSQLNEARDVLLAPGAPLPAATPASSWDPPRPAAAPTVPYPRPRDGAPPPAVVANRRVNLWWLPWPLVGLLLAWTVGNVAIGTAREGAGYGLLMGLLPGAATVAMTVVAAGWSLVWALVGSRRR